MANANDPSWYIPFMDSVEGLTEAEAFWKPSPESNSAAEIVQHLLYWNEVWQLRFCEGHINAIPPLKNNGDSFVIPEGQTFEALKAKLLAVLLQWQNLITAEKIEEDVTGFPVPAKWWEIIGNVTTHNAYHIGQIVYIRKLQKSWKTDLGRNE